MYDALAQSGEVAGKLAGDSCGDFLGSLPDDVPGVGTRWLRCDVLRVHRVRLQEDMWLLLDTDTLDGRGGFGIAEQRVGGG